MQSYNTSKTKKKAVPKTTFIILILAIIVAAAAVLVFTGGSAGGRFTELSVNPGTQYGFTEKGVVTVKGDKVVYMDLKGEEQWEMPITDSTVKIATHDEYSVVYTKNLVQAMNIDGTIMFPSVELSGEIVSVKCGPTYIAVYKIETDGKEYIYIYDFSGNRADRLEVKANTLLDYGFDNSSGMLYTLIVNTDSSMPVCTINTYDVAKGSNTGSMSLEGELVERIYFGTEGVYAMGTNNLTIFGVTGKEVSSSLIYGWSVMDFYSANSPMVLLRVRQELSTAATVEAKILSISTGDSSTFRLSTNTLGSYFHNNQVVVIQSNKLTYYDYSGQLKSTVDLEFTVTGTEKQGDKIILLTADNMYILN